jgi:hypothetical protein
MIDRCEAVHVSKFAALKLFPVVPCVQYLQRPFAAYRISTYHRFESVGIHVPCFYHENPHNV